MGAAIGISRDTLNEIGKQDNFSFKKIEYLSEEEMLDKAKKFWLQNTYNSKNDIVEELYRFYLQGYFIKRKENSFENEWRLVYSGLTLEKYGIIAQETPEEIDSYFIQDDMILFYKLPITNNNIIEIVFLGPNCKVSYNEMKFFTDKYLKRDCNIDTDSIKMR